MGLSSHCLRSAAIGNPQHGSFIFCSLVYSLSTKTPNSKDTSLLKGKGQRI